MARWTLLIPLALAACAPDQVGQQVGQSLYNASVNTGHAVATFGDRTGAALENAGANLRRTVNPPPPYYAPPPALPDAYEPPAPITAEPLGPPPGNASPIDPGDPGPLYPGDPGPRYPGDPARETPPNPGLGY